MHLFFRQRSDGLQLAGLRKKSRVIVFSLLPFFQGDCAMCKVMNFVLTVAAIVVLTIAFAPQIARADWDPTQVTKYVQMPDLSPMGMDVNATYLLDITQPTPAQPIYPYQKILADDFPCDTTGPITDIHIWGSWLNDRISTNTSFKLSIHSDVPATATTPSHPGDVLWQQTFLPGQYVPQQWDRAQEYFYEPNTDKIIGSDTQVWLYNFNIDPTSANVFVQKGTATNKMIYWLDVQAIVPEPPPPPGQLYPEFVFGWKTSYQHNLDDAVYGDTDVPGGDPIVHNDSTGLTWTWKDMHYPVGHPLWPQSIDLAFVITTVPEPGTIVMLLSVCVIGLVAYLRRR